MFTKKAISIVLTLLVIISAAACSKNPASSSTNGGGGGGGGSDCWIVTECYLAYDAWGYAYEVCEDVMYCK